MSKPNSAISWETIVDKPKSNLTFRFMSFLFGFRDFFSPRRNVLKEVEIEPGLHILDYGCGSGAYIAATADLVGRSGKIYALDIHPLAGQMVQNIASKKGVVNVEFIQSDCETGLQDNSIDVVLLYDILHTLSDPNRILQELHRVLKSDGVLSFSDHHMQENEALSRITDLGLFSLLRSGEKTYTFRKEVRQ
jgi:ubiquinone/menaquinone biosynthesis C-methylase UbiE